MLLIRFLPPSMTSAESSASFSCSRSSHSLPNQSLTCFNLRTLFSIFSLKVSRYLSMWNFIFLTDSGCTRSQNDTYSAYFSQRSWRYTVQFCYLFVQRQKYRCYSIGLKSPYSAQISKFCNVCYEHLQFYRGTLFPQKQHQMQVFYYLLLKIHPESLRKKGMLNFSLLIWQRFITFLSRQWFGAVQFQKDQELSKGQRTLTDPQLKSFEIQSMARYKSSFLTKNGSSFWQIQFY